MGGIKIKGRGRGPDKKKRKSRAKSQDATETSKKGILRNIIDTVSDKVKQTKEEPWSLDVESVRVPVLGRHVFKREKSIEIDLGKL